MNMESSRRPEMGARKPVSQRSPEEQAAFRARVEAQRSSAEREAPIRETESVDDQWEAYRKRAEIQGGIFDARGNITKEGRAKLIQERLDTTQIAFLENLQRNHVAEVTVISGRKERDEGPVMSARERPQVLADARAAAEKMLQERAANEADVRRMQGERRAAGVRARANAIYAGKGDADADRLQRQAEEAYDLRIQREKNMRAAS